MKLKIQRYLVVLLTHFLIYPVYINGVSKALQQLVIFGLIGIFTFVNFNNVQPLFKTLGNHKKNGIIGLLLLLLILSGSFLIPIIYNTSDFSYFSQILSTTLYLVFYILLVVMIRKYFENKNTKRKVLELFAEVQFHYVIVTILFLIFPQLKMKWMNLIQMTPRSIELVNSPAYISRVGWDGYAGFTSTVYATIAVVVTIYLITEFYKVYKKINFKYVIYLIFALIGNAFYGRSGLLVSLIMIFIGLIYLVVVYKKYSMLFIMIGSIGLLFILVSIAANFNSSIATWYNWAMEPIISLFKTGEIQTSSSDIMWDMWFIPELKTFLIGDGYYSSPLHSGYYMETDIGFLRPILFYGMFFTVIYYLIPIILGTSIAKDSRESKLFIFLMYLSILLFEIKGEVIFKFLPIMVMIFTASYLSGRSKNMMLKNTRKYEIGVTF